MTEQTRLDDDAESYGRHDRSYVLAHHPGRGGTFLRWHEPIKTFIHIAVPLRVRLP